MKYQKHSFWILFLVVCGIYLIVTAPPPLVDKASATLSIPIERALEILNSENKVVRSLYTKEIVLAGKKVGLKFDEDWQNETINAGPLPAQFLRLTATSLEKSPAPLGLFLGSDYPINDANNFSGQQANGFKRLKRNSKPQFFYVKDIERFTYMFADIAISKACVNCHNKHKDTPKEDWALNDIMGATTWIYPDKTISYESLIQLIVHLRKAFEFSYNSYLAKAQTFDPPVVIGERWPTNGYFLPSLKIFSDEINKRAAKQTMLSITKLMDKTDLGIQPE